MTETMPTDETTKPDKKTHPRFNHIAMSLPADRLDAAGRQEILDFYGDVFGWVELPTETVDRKTLVMMAYEFGQFVFLHASKKPLQADRGDHFGMSVSSMDDLDAFLAKAKTWQARDARVEIIDKHVEDFGVLRLHSFYLTHLLPMMIEIQYFELVEGGTYNAKTPSS